MMSVENSDRLSGLPDSVLTGEILSKLKARELVQTCVLSKRWLKLWTFVPCLDFDYSEFKSELEEEEGDVGRFKNFVSKFLCYRDATTDLHTFKICHSECETESKLSVLAAFLWIQYALEHNPKELEIQLLADGNNVHLPDCLFTCESLESVWLQVEKEECGLEYIELDDVRLPRLRRLYLSHMYFNGDNMEKLLNGCPILEAAVFINCTLDMNSVSFRNLSRLSILNCYLVSEASNCRVSAPRLEFLSFRGEIGMSVKLEDMSDVIGAVFFTDDFEETDAGYNLELLDSLSGVEILKINSSVFQKTLEGELRKCPTFRNLKNVTLGDDCMYCNFGLLSTFLKRCPNLEILTLSHQHEDVEDNEHFQEPMEIEQIESLGCNRLKKIEIMTTRYDIHVDELMRVLSRSTSEIEDLQIILSRSTNLNSA